MGVYKYRFQLDMAIYHNKSCAMSGYGNFNLPKGQAKYLLLAQWANIYLGLYM